MKRTIPCACAAAVGAALLACVPGFAGAAAGTTCSGTLAPGNYHSVVVPAGASCLSEGFVSINWGLFIEPGATFVLGSEENPVPTGRINGGVHATNPASVQIHFTSINGGIDVHGGSGPFGGPFEITWNAIEDNHINGSVTVDGAEGKLDLDTGDGGVNIAGKITSLRAHTGDGSIVFRGQPGTAMSDDWEITTGDGGVSL